MPFTDEWLVATVQPLLPPGELEKLRAASQGAPQSLWMLLIERRLAGDEQILAAVTKRFRLPAMRGIGNSAAVEVRVNAFNVFNNLNLRPFTFNSRSTQIESPDFGQAIEALAGRVVEFQGRFSF